MKNKILLFIGIFIMLLSGGLANVNALSDSLQVDDKMKGIFKIEKINSIISDYYNIKDYNNDKYPTYFGGMYANNKNIIIQIIKNKIPNKSSEEFTTYEKIVNMDDSIKINYVENSFNELNEVNQILSNYMQYNDMITTTSIDVVDNKVVVKLLNNDENNQNKIIEDIKKIKPNFNSNILKFQKGEINKVFLSLNPGQKIDATNTATCSMGFRVKYNGKNGYITAGHCTSNVNEWLPTGTVKYRQFSNQSSYDYAFVETNAFYTPTNNLAYTASGVTTLGVYSTTPFVYVDLQIAKSGYSTGYTQGTVKNINVNVNYDMEDGTFVTIKNLVEAQLTSYRGDSGAPIFIPTPDSQGGAKVVGILSGGDGQVTYFTNFVNLPPALQTRY